MRAFHKLTPDKTFIFHFRNDTGSPPSHKHLFKRKAITVAIIVFGGVAYVGMAPCSWQDQFNRKIGYRMALGRAKRQAGRMYESLGHHNSNYEYPGPLSEHPLRESEGKQKWARDLAERINGEYREC